MKNIRDFKIGKAELLRPVYNHGYNVCILVRKKWTPSKMSKLVQYYCGPKCGILLNRKPLF